LWYGLSVQPPRREAVPTTQHKVQVVSKRLTIRGFIVSDSNMGPKYAKEHQRIVQKCIADGSIKAKMSPTNGIDHAAEDLIGTLEGKIAKRWTE
jgi:NADPH-dependent curcumin reductase CurA